jgi:hypothetical protein
MQSNRSAQKNSLVERRKLAKDVRVVQSQLIALDRSIVERAAQTLCEFVFSDCDRLDGKHNWTDCDEDTKDGFRGEAAAVIETAWPFLSGGSTRSTRKARSIMRKAGGDRSARPAEPSQRRDLYR